MYFEAQQTNDEKVLNDTEGKDVKDLANVNKNVTHQIFKSQEIRTSSKVITKSWTKSGGEKSEIQDYRNSNYIINRRSRQGTMEGKKTNMNEAEIQTDEKYLKVLKGMHCIFYILDSKRKESLKESFLTISKSDSAAQIYHAVYLVAVKIKLLLNRSFMKWKLESIFEKTRNLQKATLSIENSCINGICINKRFLEKSEIETQTSISFINIIKWVNIMVHILEFNKKISLIEGFTKISQFNQKSLKLRALRIITRRLMQSIKQGFHKWTLFYIIAKEKDKKISNLKIESLSTLANNIHRIPEIEKVHIEMQTDINYLDFIRTIQCLFSILNYKRKLVLKNSFCCIENANDFSFYRKSLRILNNKIKATLAYAIMKWKVKCDFRVCVNMKIDMLNREKTDWEARSKGFLILFKIELTYKYFAFSAIQKQCLTKNHNSEIEYASNQLKLHKFDSAIQRLFQLIKKINCIYSQTYFISWKNCISALKIKNLELELSSERTQKASLFFLYVNNKIKKQNVWKYFYKLRLNAIKISQKIFLAKLTQKEKLISAKKISSLLYLFIFKSNQKFFGKLRIFSLEKSYWIALRQSKAKFIFSIYNRKWLIKLHDSLLLWKLNWKSKQLYSLHNLINEIKLKRSELSKSITNERIELDDLDKKILVQQNLIKGLLNEYDEADNLNESSQSQDTTRCNDSSAFTPIKSPCSLANFSPSITPIPKPKSRSPIVSDFSLKKQTHTEKSPPKKTLHIQYKSASDSNGLLMILIVIISIIICILLLLN